MRVDCFEELRSWQRSRELTVTIYKVLFDLKDYSFKDQICRASVSVSNNLAEGFGRRSKKELIYFFRIAKGSITEVKSMLYIAEDLKYIPKEKCIKLRAEYDEIGRLIGAFIKSIS